MAQLIDDVLQLARVTRSEMHSEVVNLSETARLVVAELHKGDAERAVAVTVEEADPWRGAISAFSTTSRSPAASPTSSGHARRPTRCSTPPQKASSQRPPDSAPRSSGCSTTRGRRRSRELRRPVARPARHRLHDPRQAALPGVRRRAQGRDGQGDRAVLRRGAEERPEPDELRRLRLHDAQRPAGEALRHPRRRRAGVPQGDAAAGQPPRRRADDGQRAEGDGQRHDDLAGPARRVGAGPHPRHAAAAAAGGRARPSSRTSAAPTTIREQLPSTASGATCASCHAKIDPPGFALESFDVIGGWRENYRGVGKEFPAPKPSRGRPAQT